MTVSSVDSNPSPMVAKPPPARMADLAYHDLLSPPEVVDIRAKARQFAEEHVAPRGHEIGQKDESVESFPWDVFRAMAEADLFRVPFAAEIGGLGLKHRVLATATVIEELAYHSNSIAAIYDVHCILAGRTLERASTDLQRAYLTPLIEGSLVGSFATSEPLASSDLSPQSLQTRAERDGDCYVVNGHKRWITNSPVASFVIALCNTPEGPVALLIDLNADGVTVGTPDRKLGNRGQLTADILFRGVRVPTSHVIGRVGKGLHVALSTLTYGRIGIAASGVGMAQNAFDHTMAHLKSRAAFGRKLAQFQHWQFRMADRATQIENARNLYVKAALRMDLGVEFPEPESAMAKFYATEAAVDMARDGIQVLGGYGFMRELAYDGSHYKLEEIYRDAKIAEIYEGTNEIQRLIVARSLFGKEMTG